VTAKSNETIANETAASVEKYLSCPIGHGRLRVDDGRITSDEPAFKGSIIDGVAVVSDSIQKTFFDDKYETMQKGHEKSGEWEFCYAQQTSLLSSYLRGGQVILDVGCGPSIPYSRPVGARLVGLEPSFDSIRVNDKVDLRVNGSATAIPMATASVDVIVCFYSIHHMVGRDVDDTRGYVASAFKEFGRVLKPGGILFVFEMTPAIFFEGLQALLWNGIRRLAPKMLDMYFWSANSLVGMAKEKMPPGTISEKIVFGIPALTTIRPVFNLPWLKVPRIIYPLDARLYKWRTPPRESGSDTEPAP
jgi:SAM-dependent methyltransferase